MQMSDRTNAAWDVAGNIEGFARVWRTNSFAAEFLLYPGGKGFYKAVGKKGQKLRAQGWFPPGRRLRQESGRNLSTVQAGAPSSRFRGCEKCIAKRGAGDYNRIRREK